MATTGEPFGLFWDSESGDRTYSAASFEYWLKKFFTSGVFNGDLQVNASSGMTLEIEPGYANVDGKVKFWNGAFTLTLNAANSTYPRIDTIVITRDNVNRQIVCEVVTGSYSGDTPQPTAPVRNSEIYQLVLAQIYVGAGVTGITQANITDTRPDNTLCGWITGTVEELDFSQFTAQFEQYFREFKADAEGDYESWFNEVQSEQIEDKEAWDAWYAALQEELHNLPADSAEYLQIQIDELKESGLSGSIFKVTTINPSLEGKTVRIISADNTEEKTGTFDSNLECVIYGMKSVGEITITSTDGIQTATSVVSIPYFGNYTVPIAFWAATVNMQGDTNLYGATITIKDSDDLTVGTVVLSAVDGTGTFTASKADTYTFNYTYQGTSYSEELVVSEETTYSISLSAGFSWQIWVDTASQLDSTDYESLDEVLEDEKALRELFLEHACVDYMASLSSSNEDLETVINNDLCAKWINLSDYALDFLHANEVIADLMDEADKYGYGEWALMPQVPKMTSNTAPYGTASASSIASTTYDAYKAFDNDVSTRWVASNGVTNNYLAYAFVSSTRISKVSILFYFGVSSGYTAPSRTFKLQGYDGTAWVDIETVTTQAVSTSATTLLKELEISGTYEGIRLFCSDSIGVANQWNIGISSLQFYAWAPKGNVPVMTGATAPYGTTSASSTYSGRNSYNAFDGDYSTIYSSAADHPRTSFYLQYDSVNPINLKGGKINAKSNGATYYYDVVLKGSNDGSTWTILTETLRIQSADYEEYSFVSNGDTNYYKMIRLTCEATNATSMNSGAGALLINTLQFYGRELKVSVPTMTSATAPYGAVSASGYYDNNYLPYMAFKGFNSSTSSGNSWAASAGSNHWIGYAFTNKTKVKAFSFGVYNNSSRSFTGIKLLGSNDNFVSDSHELYSDSKAYGSASSLFTYLTENDAEYKYYRLAITKNGATTSTSPLLGGINFYGLDYSEKEFEAGTTKKWLYDHGVELETFDAGYSCEKEPSQLVSNGIGGTSTAEINSTIIITENMIDFTTYNLVRGILGDKNKFASNAYGYIKLAEAYADSYAYVFVQSITNPNTTVAIDVSSINVNHKVMVVCGNVANRQLSVSELWLE